jgi:hypothetical protein
MKFLLILAIMSICDFILPIQVRISGGFFEGLDQSPAIDMFRREYGLFSITRFSAISSACIFIGLYDFIARDILVYLGAASVLCWFFVAMRDALVAKNKVDSYFKSRIDSVDLDRNLDPR